MAVIKNLNFASGKTTATNYFEGKGIEVIDADEISRNLQLKGAPGYQKIIEKFGKEILQLVNGVTKLSKIETYTENKFQAENFRKLILAMSKDIRVLLVKLADRLHNMRTIQFIPQEKRRQRIASETLEIYAPLAGRLGMHEFKDELEDLSFQILNPSA